MTKAVHVCDRTNIANGLNSGLPSILIPSHDTSGCIPFGLGSTAHIGKIFSSGSGFPFRTHTSRVGTGSSELLSHLTDTFIPEKKNWEAATNNNPKLSSKKDFHHAKIVRRGVCLEGSSGDVSFALIAPAGNARSSDNADKDVLRVDADE